MIVADLLHQQLDARVTQEYEALRRYEEYLESIKEKMSPRIRFKKAVEESVRDRVDRLICKSKPAPKVECSQSGNAFYREWYRNEQEYWAKVLWKHQMVKRT